MDATGTSHLRYDAFVDREGLLIGATSFTQGAVIATAAYWAGGWRLSLGLWAAALAANVLVVWGLSRRRDRFRAVMVGCESGNRTPMDFATFDTRTKAQAFCDKLNAVDENRLTFFTWEKVPK